MAYLCKYPLGKGFIGEQMPSEVAKIPISQKKMQKKIKITKFFVFCFFRYIFVVGPYLKHFYGVKFIGEPGKF